MQATHLEQRERTYSIHSITQDFSKLTLNPCCSLFDKVMSYQFGISNEGKKERNIQEYAVLCFVASKGLFPIREFVSKTLSSKAIYDLFRTYHGIDCSDIEAPPNKITFWHTAYKRVSDQNLIRLWDRLECQQKVPHLTNADSIRNWFIENQSFIEGISELHLNRCHLTLLPEEIGYFTNLKKLHSMIMLFFHFRNLFCTFSLYKL